MKNVLLACNKLSSSNIAAVFKEIEESFKQDKSAASSALVSAFTEENIEHNLLAVSSILKLVHSVLDQTVVEKVLGNIANIPLYGYLYNYGVLDSSFIDASLKSLLDARAYLSVLQILQMCSSLLSTGALQSIKERVGAEKDAASFSFLAEFLVESADLVLQHRNPYRDVLKEEMESIKATVEEIVKHSTNKLVCALSMSEDAEDALALKYGMNTALKKRIFRILTTSKDYPEAQTLLYKEGLRVKQFEEVFYLLMYFCMQETKYNKYYADLSISLISTASSSHRGTFNKYMYTAIERQLSLLEKLSVKEIYNFSGFVAALYLEGLITIRCISKLAYCTKKEKILGKVLFKHVLTHFLSGEPLRVKKMRESDTLKKFFQTDLIDNTFLKREHKPAISSIYQQIHKDL
ncbi:hypothetical protein NECID01_0439 [Nematocida sp. AWRm77]|nr:hypothetical protein NECID01_0439 [Nematocida sp. AWRm77]